jgi:D-alanyl-D-alanine carboxypeptidase
LLEVSATQSTVTSRTTAVEHQVLGAAFVGIYDGKLPAEFVSRNLRTQTMATPANSMVDATAASLVFGPFRLLPMQRLLTEVGTPIP